MSIPIELQVALAPGQTTVPQLQNPDGRLHALVIPTGQSFVATDISVSRLSVVAAPVLVGLILEQTVGTGIFARWTFAGQIAQNIERAFTTGIRFTTPFNVNLLAASGDSFSVRIHGFFV